MNSWVGLCLHSDSIKIESSSWRTLASTWTSSSMKLLFVFVCCVEHWFKWMYALPGQYDLNIHDSLSPFLITIAMSVFTYCEQKNLEIFQANKTELANNLECGIRGGQWMARSWSLRPHFVLACVCPNRAPHLWPQVMRGYIKHRKLLLLLSWPAVVWLWPWDWLIVHS